MNRSLALSLIVAIAPALLSGCGSADNARPANEPATSTPAGADTLTARADAARIQGSANAPLWIVEVSDFQCPFCRIWHDSVYATLLREYVRPGTVRMAYINLPLPNHANALPAAEVAMCAGVQGKFWEVHDALFDTQDTWAGMPNASALFDSLARSRGVDVDGLRRCVTSGALRPLIEADAARAREAGVTGTPAFIIGGDVLLQGMQPIEAFRRVIAQKLGGSGASR